MLNSDGDVCAVSMMRSESVSSRIEMTPNDLADRLVRVLIDSSSQIDGLSHDIQDYADLTSGPALDKLSPKSFEADIDREAMRIARLASKLLHDAAGLIERPDLDSARRSMLIEQSAKLHLAMTRLRPVPHVYSLDEPVTYTGGWSEFATAVKSDSARASNTTPIQPLQRPVSILPDVVDGPNLAIQSSSPLSTMDVDDFDLLSAYTRDHSEIAFRKLVDRHAGFVYAICRRRLRDEHLAEDAVQKVFLLLANKSNTASTGPLRPLLYSFAVGACTEIRRSQARQAAKEQALAAAKKMATSSANFAQGRIAAMTAALDRIPAIYHDVIELRYIHGFTVPEVAAATGISPHAAQKRLVRGLSELRARLSDAGFAAFFGIPSILSQLKESSPSGLADRTSSAVLSKIRTAKAPGVRPRAASPRIFSIGTLFGLVAILAAATGSFVFRLVMGSQQTTRATTVKETRPPAMLPPTTSLVAPPTSLRQRLRHQIDPTQIREGELDRVFDVMSVREDVPIKVDWASLQTIGFTGKTSVYTQRIDGTVLDEIDAVLTAVDPNRQLERVETPDYVLIRASANRPSSRP
jgi:RNA polymerase sigma factor (sigma-70 family)